MQRGEGPSHPAFPASLSPRLFMGLQHKLGFFPSPFIFSSLPFLPYFCKLNYLNALFGSLKSQRFPLFPPWLPFLSLLSAPAFSGSFPVLFQWHLLKFAQKKILLQCHHFSPGRRFMGAGRHPWRGGFAGEKETKEEEEIWWKSKGCLELGSREGAEGTRGQSCSSTGDTHGDTGRVGIEEFSVRVVWVNGGSTDIPGWPQAQVTLGTWPGERLAWLGGA